MAKLFGVTLKKLHKGTDHEGCALYSADVYYNGKCLGSWEQDAWGGPDRMDFDKNLLQDAVEQFKQSDLVNPKYKDLANVSILLDKLVGLCEDEKLYKKGLKNGFNAFIIQEYGYRQGFWMNGTLEDIKASKDYKELVERSRGVNVRIYTDIMDFEVA